MGQEASLPQETGEPGLDPPSQALPRSSSSSSSAAAAARNGDRSTSARPGKALKQIFHRQHADTNHGRDTARVAAELGHLDSSNNTHDSSAAAYAAAGHYATQQQQPEAYALQHASGTLNGNMMTPPSKQYAEVGVMYSADDPAPQRNLSALVAGASRKGVRPGKGLISSMRNMAIGGGSRPPSASTSPEGDQKQQAAGLFKTTGLSPPKGGTRDWETRWDEDDEDDSSSDEDETMTRPVSGDLLGLNDVSMRPGMDAAHSSSHSMRPPAVHVSSRQEELISTDMTKSPQESTLLPTGPAVPSQGPDDEREWDTGAMVGKEAGYEKPNVEMFLPMLRVLGKGSFGKVVLVQKRRGKENGQLYAMKILRKTHLVKRRQIERTRTERKVLSFVDHPFIMKLHYAFQSDDKLYLVLDYCPGGELFFHLSRFRRFPERVARFYAAELLLAIGHLHKRGIIYRDLKPENVLLDADGHVKLGDFGLAKAGIRHPCEGALSMCGTPEYMAPEVLSQAGHGFCVDYWGLGMLAYEMMTGLPPWYTTDRAKLFRRLKSAPLEIPSYFSPQSADCIGGLLERNPRRRLGVTGIRVTMEHEFFRSINWRALYARRVEAPIRPCEGWKPPEAGDEEEPGHETLEKATANFDNQFTRMPVESDGASNEAHDDDEVELEELHANTFVGFTFDEQKEQKEDSPLALVGPRTQRTAE